jgi:polyisoprenoid-binding protein YceI
LGSLASQAAVSISVDPSSSEAEFLAIGKPSAIKIKGTHAKPEGKITLTNDGKATGQIRLNLDDFDSGIEMRDHHMKEKYLETGKADNKMAVLTITSVDLPKDFWKAPHPLNTSFAGKLKLHGKEKDVTGQMNLSSVTSSIAQGEAKFSLELPDYGIEVPSYSGITVAQKVDVDVNFKGAIHSL